MFTLLVIVIIFDTRVKLIGNQILIMINPVTAATQFNDCVHKLFCLSNVTYTTQILIFKNKFRDQVIK